MPIPEIRSPEEVSQPVAKVLHFRSNISGLLAARPAVRMLAFAFDFALLHGLAIVTAQWLCVLMLRQLLQAKVMTNGVVVSAPVFHACYQYGVGLIWPVTLLFLGFIYYVASAHLWGASLGQGLLGLRVVTRAGELPSLESAGKRYFASVFTLFSMGFFFFLGAYSREGLCFHDEASGTRVVRRDSVAPQAAVNPEARPVGEYTAEDRIQLDRVA